MAYTADDLVHRISFDAVGSAEAPALGVIFENRIASTAYAGYSDGMRSKLGTWTASELSRFLKDPQTSVPGTSMPNPGIKDPIIINGIIEVLEKIKEAE